MGTGMMRNNGSPGTWRRRAALCPVLIACLIAAVTAGQAMAADAGQRVLRVGPDGEFARPSQAARDATDGDTVLIQAGRYRGNAAVWRADNLTIRGVGGEVVLEAAGTAAEGKAIWVVKGDDILIESITFTDAKVPDRNGAGIRAEGRNLTIRDCVFHHNQMGLLTGHNAKSRLRITGSEFYANGVTESGASAIGHNIYVGRIARFTLKSSYFHHAIRGHHVKSRAQFNRIEYNRITDEADSHGSYLIDIAEGGTAIILGNVLRQNAHTENWHLISIGAEGNRPDSSFAVVHNTMINAASGGVFVINRTQSMGIAANNIIVGPGTLLKGPGRVGGNKEAAAGDFADFDALDLELAPGAGAIDAGVSLSLQPQSEYAHPRGMKDRRIVDAPDAGAYEFTSDTQ